MSTTTNSHSTICLPAHILDAHIAPRAREVLMLLASQTSADSPALWICQATIAARLRCSTATVARAIQKLLEAKLIAETGQLHQGRYKFYHVRWSGDENLKALTKKIPSYASSLRLSSGSQEASEGKPKPVRKVVALRTNNTTPKPFEGVQLILPPVEAVDEVRLCSELPLRENPPTPFACPSGYSKGGESTLPPSTISPQAILKDSRIAYYAEVARKRHQESRQLHQSILLSLR